MQALRKRSGPSLSWAALAVAGALLASCANAPPPDPAQQCLNLGHSPTSQSYLACVDRITAEREAKSE